MRKNIIDEISIKMMDFDYKDDQLIKFIESNVVDINEKGLDGRTLAIHTAVYGRHGVFLYLISKGADLESCDKIGYTPLHAAVSAKKNEIVKELLKNGVNVNCKDNNGNSPLLHASHLSVDIIELLLEYGADPTLKNKFGSCAYDVFGAYSSIVSLMDKYKEGVL